MYLYIYNQWLYPENGYTFLHRTLWSYFTTLNSSFNASSWLSLDLSYPYQNGKLSLCGYYKRTKTWRDSTDLRNLYVVRIFCIYSGLLFHVDMYVFSLVKLTRLCTKCVCICVCACIRARAQLVFDSCIAIKASCLHNYFYLQIHTTRERNQKKNIRNAYIQNFYWYMYRLFMQYKCL